MATIDVDRLRALVDASERSARAISLDAGLGDTAVKDILSGKSRSPSGKTVSALAATLQVSVETLFGGAPESDVSRPALSRPLLTNAVGDPVSLAEVRSYLRPLQPAPPPKQIGRLRPIVRRIPVVGEVAAGEWREAIALQLADVEEYLPMDIPGYEQAQLTALKVVGPSMNLVYPEGRFVVTAHPAEAGLRIGDYVVVERHKLDLVELTLKEFTVDADGRIALWPRSSDYRFQEPIYLKPGEHDELDQTAPLIVGVVVGDYGKRERPPMSFARS